MIYLVRHGQTDWNLFRKFNGSTDSFLNKTGIEQAENLAEQLKDINFDACFCSTLTRAKQYCEIIFKETVFFDDRLTEIGCGEFEGTDETAEMMQVFMQAIYTGEKGTETYQAFIKRNCEVCDIIAEKYSEKNVLVITHSANASVIDYYFKGKPKDYNFGKRIVEQGKFTLIEN